MKNLWKSSKTPSIKVSFYSDGSYKLISNVLLSRFEQRFRAFGVVNGTRYKEYCLSNDYAFRSSTLALIQIDWWYMCTALKSSGVIETSRDFKMEFIEPEKKISDNLGEL